MLSLAETISDIRTKIANCLTSSNKDAAMLSSDTSISIKAPTIAVDGTTSINNLTVTKELNIPGGKIWIE